MKIALSDTLLIYITPDDDYTGQRGFGREGIFLGVKGLQDMPTMTLILLAFMGLCLCYHVQGRFEHLSRYPPEDQVKIMKRMLKFDDEQIIEHWWSTEDLTCKEVHSVWQIFNQSIKADLSLLMKDAEKHLKQVPPPKNRKMRRCIEDIKETIEVAVQEGVDSFIVCIGKSLKVQEQKMTEMEIKRDMYRKSINYTLDNLERCLEHSNTNSEVHRKRCIAQTVTVSETQFESACDNVFGESQCMAHFTNGILECTSEAMNNIAAKKGQLKEDIDRCVGYSYFNPENQNFGSTIKNMLSYYEDAYKRLNKAYYSIIKDYSKNIFQLRIDEEEFEQLHKDNLNRYLQGYYYSLRKTWDENRSIRERQCYFKAIEKLNNLTAEGIKDFTECEKSFIRQRVEVVVTFTNIVKEFNTKLREAGNVALLRCFGQRPQDIFNSEAIRQCAELARQSINWEWNKAKTKLAIMVGSFKPIQIMPNNKTCGPLRESKLRLDADKILNDCTRCIYGGSGDFYAVTTPPSSTEQETTTTKGTLPPTAKLI